MGVTSWHNWIVKHTSLGWRHWIPCLVPEGSWSCWYVNNLKDPLCINSAKVTAVSLIILKLWWARWWAVLSYCSVTWGHILWLILYERSLRSQKTDENWTLTCIGTEGLLGGLRCFLKSGFQWFWWYFSTYVPLDIRLARCSEKWGRHGQVSLLPILCPLWRSTLHVS